MMKRKEKVEGAWLQLEESGVTVANDEKKRKRESVRRIRNGGAFTLDHFLFMDSHYD